MPTDRDDELTITESTLLGIAEVLAQDFEHFDPQELGKVAVRAQIGTGLAAVYQAIELGRLVNAVNGATIAIEVLTQTVQKGGGVNPKLLEALGEIRKVISANG